MDGQADVSMARYKEILKHIHAYLGPGYLTHFSPTNDVGQRISTWKEKELNPYLTLYIKFNFRCILYLNVKDKTKLLVDNIVYSFPTLREKKNLPKKGT